MDETIPAGKVTYCAFFRVHSHMALLLIDFFFFFEKNFEDEPKYLATILFECLTAEKRILDDAFNQQVR